jgi:MFS family permease
MAAAVMMAMGWGTIYTYGVFFDALLNQFGWSRAVTSAAYSLSTFVYGVFSIISGRLTDKLGPRLVSTVFSIIFAGGLLLCLLAWPAMSWGQDALVVYSSVDEENAKALLDAFTKATNMCSSVQLMQDSVSPNMPIVFRYTIANLGDLKVSIWLQNVKA